MGTKESKGKEDAYELPTKQVWMSIGCGGLPENPVRQELGGCKQEGTADNGDVWGSWWLLDTGEAGRQQCQVYCCG